MWMFAFVERVVGGTYEELANKSSTRTCPLYFSEKQVGTSRRGQRVSTTVAVKKQCESIDWRRPLTLHNVAALEQTTSSKAQILSDKALNITSGQSEYSKPRYCTTQATVNHIHTLYSIDCPHTFKFEVRMKKNCPCKNKTVQQTVNQVINCLSARTHALSLGGHWLMALSRWRSAWT